MVDMRFRKGKVGTYCPLEKYSFAMTFGAWRASAATPQMAPVQGLTRTLSKREAVFSNRTNKIDATTEIRSPVDPVSAELAILPQD